MLRKALNKKKKGFTLIELIIVIAIIAILAAVALPKFMEMRENGNSKADISTAKNLQTVVAGLVADNKLAVPATINLSTNDATTTKINNQLQDAPVLKAKDGKGKNIIVSIDATGNIAIYYTSVATTTKIYPDGVGSYAN